jgi:flagellin-like protein
MRRSRGVSGFVATLILVAITLSLSYVVFQGVSRLTTPRDEIFSNQVLDIGGSPDLLRFQVNASSASSPQAFQADDASSGGGVLYFNGTGYGTTRQLCIPGATTFFSVYASTAGLLRAEANGRVWIDGYWTGSLEVQPGWHELMFSDSTSCTVTDPDGSDLSFPDALVSSLPLTGSIPSTGFVIYVPTDGARHSLVLVFDGGFDTLA